MAFPDQNPLNNGTIADLREILSRSQSENQESKLLLGQIEALMQDIEKKARPSNSQRQASNVTPAMGMPTTAPVTF